MEQYNAKINTSNLLSSFNAASDYGTIGILKWFNDISDKRQVFDESLCNSLITTLKSRGYASLTSPADELKSFKSLMQKDEVRTPEEIGSTLIALIIRSLKESNGLAPYIEQLISVFNQTYNKEDTYKSMMKNLSAFVGSSVVFVVIRNRTVNLLSGKLEEVIPFDKVMIDGASYPFIGYNVEINKITSNDGKILYSNILSSPKDDLTDEAGIAKKNRDLFGNNYPLESKLL